MTDSFARSPIVVCGADVPSQAVFCPKCGERLQESSAPPQKNPKQQVAQKLKSSEQIGTAEDYDPEQDLWSGGYSGKAMIGSWAAAAVATVAALIAGIALQVGQVGWLVLAGLVLLVWVWLGLTLAVRKLSVHYQLTSQRFIHRHGILTRTTDRIEVIDMDDVTFKQGLVQRMFGVGKVVISSTDRSHPELVLKGIADVQRVANLIDDVRRTERRRRGLHIEAI